MDVLNQANTEVLKEPRGFIKIIEIILAIFAFATCTAYHSSTSYAVNCNGTLVGPYSLNFGYPFKLKEGMLKANTCGSSTDIHMWGDFTAASQFYVFVGVTAFLYSLGILIFYVFGDDKYRNVELIPMVDFIVHAVYAVFWLISSSVWADGVTKIKHYTDPNDYFVCEYIAECYSGCSKPYVAATSCSVTDSGNYATLNVSIIFGFLCMCVWLGNLWFLYKETKWFKASEMPPPMPDQSTPEMPQKI